MNEYRIIKLVTGEDVLVDAEDYYWLVVHRWRKHTSGYVVTGQAVLMHRLLNQTPHGMDTDHINRNKLDNRKANLRSVSHAENMLNQGNYKNNTSGFKGVRWHTKTKKWEAYICRERKMFSLGYFHDPSEAARRREEVLRAW